jgi:enoyl-[acyl-carrier protein] reductase/trans-2-enoyl-CoA reductase (NAD+)
MELSLPSFQFRFMAAAGNVIFPGNFHPVGSQVGARKMVEFASADAKPTAGAGGRWLVVGGSGGFGSAARVALACDHGAHTVNVSFDQQPNSESKNKIRKIGSPGFHRNLAIESELRKRDLEAFSYNADAFDPAQRAEILADIKEKFAGEKFDGIVWALAAPRGLDPRTGKAVRSTLKPVGKTAKVRTFAAPESEEGGAPIKEFKIEPGSPEEAINTIFVMGGQVVQAWMDAMLEADLLNTGATLLTISYRGNPLNSDVYRNGLIGLAKADLEFTTKAVSAQLATAVEGRAYAVEGPAVVTEASGAIPGVPLYMALIADVMGEEFENPIQNMRRLFRQHIVGVEEPTLDTEGLIRMDDRELAEEVQAKMQARFDALPVNAELDRGLFEQFMSEYQMTRGFGIDGVDYEAAFDTDAVCKLD